MTIDEALYKFLTDAPAVKTLVGTRIYPQRLPQKGTYPQITYRRISGQRHHNIDVAYPVFQISCWTEDKPAGSGYAGAQLVAEAVRRTLQREKRVMSGVPVIQCVFENQNDFYEDDTGRHQVALDFKIIYREE